MTRIERANTKRGFTIIELMIATAVFSIILLIVTAAILQFSKQYYKGVVSSQTQGAARTLIDDVSRAIQYNGGDVVPISNGSTKGYCIGGGKRYSYRLGIQVEDSGPNTAMNRDYHGLVSDTMSGCNSATLPANITTPVPTPPGPGTLMNWREVLSEHMRLSKFQISGSSPYTVSVRVVYGDSDLLCSPAAGDCNTPGPSSSAVISTATDLTCRSKAGAQFCAVSELSTTITKRVQ